MGKTSIPAVNRYNKKTYDIISARIPKDMAENFKKKCIMENISQAQIIKNAISDFLNEE